MTITDIERALRARLEKDQQDDEIGHQIHLAIKATLQQFEGKKLTKRFTDKATEAIKPLFPGQHPSISWTGPDKCSVWVNPQIAFDNRLIFYVAGGYQPTEPVYHGHWIGECHAEGFEQTDACHGQAALTRIAQRKALLNPAPRYQGTQDLRLIELAQYVNKIRTVWNKFDDFCDTLESGVAYEAKRLTHLKATYGRD